MGKDEGTSSTKPPCKTTDQTNIITFRYNHPFKKLDIFSEIFRLTAQAVKAKKLVRAVPATGSA
jgi:hypothetical protein